MSETINPAEKDHWVCARCNRQLELKPVRVEYMGSAFPVDLPQCPQCGQVFIPENLALGRMVEVEKSLEDK
jgi:hypothetical protein